MAITGASRKFCCPYPRFGRQAVLVFLDTANRHQLSLHSVSIIRAQAIYTDWISQQECDSQQKLLIVSDATLYHFGILTSNVHMAWTRVVCRRLKSDYQYSSAVVYNNFPWPSPTNEQKAKIEQTAQAILDARALYPDASLADLYDELTMPPELRRAHQANDRAVMAAYGFPVKNFTENGCVAALMKMYQELTAKERR